MPPLSLMVKPVSGACNMRCTYCFYADELRRRGEPPLGVMADDTLECLMRRAFAYADGSVSLAFQGGEPTLAGAAFFERVLRLVRLYNARRLPVSLAMQTNGLELTDELLGVLKRGGFLVGVSLDGTRDIHDSRRVDALGGATYDRVQRTLQRLRAATIPYNILCVVDQAIAQRPAEVYDALAPHGYLQFIPRIDDLGASPADALDAENYGRFLIEVFRRYARDFRAGRFVSVRLFDNWLNMLCGQPPESCGMAGVCGLSFLAESNGDIYPCDFYALDEWRLGNIKESALRRLATSPVGERFRAASRPVADECRECAWFSLCRGGCRRDREPALGDGMSLNRLCAGYRLFFESCYDDLVALAQLEPPGAPVQG